MLFLQISRHSPESCPMHDEKTKEIMMDFMNQMPQLLRKHGIKMIGSWVSIPEHLIVTVFDVPSLEDITKFMMEPEAMPWAGYNTTETRPAMIPEETMKLIK